MPTANLFVYGSLMNDEVVQCLLGTSLPKRSAKLLGYKRKGVLGEAYPAMFECKHSEVEGCILLGLTPAQIQRLDLYEGYQYQRISVQAELRNELLGERVERGEWGDSMINCETYVFKREYMHLLSGDDWCNEDFRTHRMAAFIRQA